MVDTPKLPLQENIPPALCTVGCRQWVDGRELRGGRGTSRDGTLPASAGASDNLPGFNSRVFPEPLSEQRREPMGSAAVSHRSCSHIPPALCQVLMFVGDASERGDGCDTQGVSKFVKLRKAARKNGKHKGKIVSWVSSDSQVIRTCPWRRAPWPQRRSRWRWRGSSACERSWCAESLSCALCTLEFFLMVLMGFLRKQIIAALKAAAAAAAPSSPPPPPPLTRTNSCRCHDTKDTCDARHIVTL